MSTNQDNALSETLPDIKLPEIEIKSRRIVISGNFAAMEEAISAQLEKYRRVVVTADTIKSGKNLIKDLNASRKALKSRCKDEVTKASEPITHFNAEVEKLLEMFDDVTLELKDQIEAFESKTKKDIKKKLEAYLHALFEQEGIRDEFRTANVDGLVLLSSQTPKGNLTAKAGDAIRSRVQVNKNLQVQTDLRLSQLTAKGFEAGLSAPLNEGHVKHFLYDDEPLYSEKLEQLMESEIERENQAISIRASRSAREATQEQVVQKAQEEAIEAQANLRPVASAEPAQKPQNAPAATHGAVIVACTFEVPVADNVPEEAVKAAVLEKLEEAGFTTLTSITTTRTPQQQVA